MDTYILRGTYGEWSGGTQVDIIHAHNGADEAIVFPVCMTNVDLEASFLVPWDMLVKRRNRTTFVPVETRKERRLIKAKEDEIIKSLGG